MGFSALAEKRLEIIKKDPKEFKEFKLPATKAKATPKPKKK